jgi:hypothetical protein
MTTPEDCPYLLRSGDKRIDERSAGDVGNAMERTIRGEQDRVTEGTDTLFEPSTLLRGGPYIRQRDAGRALLEEHDLIDQRDQGDMGRRPKILPDHYDGKKDWQQYLAHFETVAQLNRWTLLEKRQYLAVSLRGEACTIMQSLTTEERNDYYSLCDAMERRINPGNKVNLFRSQLRSRVRGDKETLPQLAQSIRTLALRAYPNAERELFESLCSDHFLDAIGDSEARSMLCLTQHSGLDDLVGMAVQLEANRQVERQRNPKKFIRELKPYYEEPQSEGLACNEVARQGQKLEIKTQLETINKAISQMRKDIDDMKGNRRHQNAKCFHCNEMGHIRPNCPRLQDTNQASNRVSQLN